ncbi:hypothetical protein P2559Y_0042 [Croceibacter phage P2559Y]|uniref:hypothetical protein n=1 Tax=Croceibacter phage P2559Y TaxID=1327037 RepID=UPI0003F4A9D0|nr:hypothetical protein P2559Y_0042 [Croceibacter phage P2559Y]AGM14105.1 hypothetical protein P2559Y_0042 [Croceibacter phage P2559Y]
MDLDKFFIFTNPLAWVYFILYLIWLGIKGFLDFTGIFDWYYVLFKLKNMEKRNRKDLVFVFTNKKNKFFWPKQKAWEYATKIIKKTR